MQGRGNKLQDSNHHPQNSTPSPKFGPNSRRLNSKRIRQRVIIAGSLVGQRA